jgi:transcriptional regulator with XRE-family HTH domain
MKIEKKLIQIGERIRELRIKSGYASHENFAYDNGIPRKTMWRAEKGLNIKLETLIKIVNALNMSLEEFFKGL